MAMLVYEGNQVELDGECVLGRQRDNPIVLKDGAASRRHARVFQADGHWWVEDLGSANGTKVNGARIAKRRGLRNGDAIRIGDAEVQFHCAERESAPEAQAPAVRVDPQSLEGRMVGGYLIGRLMGRSGMGFLYRAEQTSLKRTVAFKVFSRKVCEDDPQFAERFREPPRGEVYVTCATPGEAKGNHFHRKMGEWFAVVQGEATIEIVDPETAQRRSIPLGVSRPRSVYIPPGLAHAVVNSSSAPVVCVAWAERDHDPDDVFPFAVWPPA